MEDVATHRAFSEFFPIYEPGPKFWALDSEFLMSGRSGHPEDVQTVQFSDGTPENTFVFEEPTELKDWLYQHHRIKVMYGFALLCDLGSIEEWLGSKCIPQPKPRGSQLVGHMRYRSFKATVYDARPLLQNFGIRKLEDAGRLVGFPKRAKPEWLGLRHWQSEHEHEDFLAYARADAVITSLAVKWLYDHCKADPRLHASAGTLARDTFDLPKRLCRVKKTVMLSPIEQKVKNCCFAGRSEVFVNGFTRNAVYNDAKSLYPCSVAATRALEIVSIEPCSPSDLSIGSDVALDDIRYGWVEGTFKSDNDIWGIPQRGHNNFYCTGTLTGFFHTFDLCASKCEVLHIAHAYRPIFKKDSEIHDQYVSMLLKRIEGHQTQDEKMLSKAVLNSLSGKLGQSHPIARTSNFFGYSTLLAHSHFVMSKLFDKCTAEPLGMDTDSIFNQSDMSGKYWDLSDGENSIPIIMEKKGEGDLCFFRSKNYIMKSKEGEDVVGRHGWVYFYSDYLKLFDGTVTKLRTRQDIKHTLLTRQKEALKMAKGRWRTKPVTLTLDKIKSLVKADPKRDRVTYDSYQLVIDKRNCSSQAWNYEDLLTMEKNPIL